MEIKASSDTDVQQRIPTPAWTGPADPRVTESRTITAESVLKSRKSCRSAGGDIRCFYCSWSLVPAARKPVISAPEQANNTISKSSDGQTSPTCLLSTGSSRNFIGSPYPSVPTRWMDASSAVSIHQAKEGKRVPGVFNGGGGY